MHVAVPGRVRLLVPGLLHSEPVAERLKRGLLVLPGLHSASANPLTGTLLVLFDPALPVARIVQRVERLLDSRAPNRGLDDAGGDEAWHMREAGAVAAEFGTSVETGLSPGGARERLTTFATNTLAPPAVRSGLAILAHQFQNLPVGLLAVAAGISLLTGAILETVAILAVVAANGALGYAVESRSERTIGSLARPIGTTAQVVRNGQELQAPLESIVPGDVLLLRRGTVIPADARVVAARDLTVSEALLTGESQPVPKSPATLSGNNVGLPDRTNMVYRGTVVTGGSGRVIAVATGARTEMGRIQRMVAGVATPATPMQRQLDDIGRQLVWLALAVSGMVFGAGVLRGFGLIQMFRSALSLAVAAIPEGLPTVATTTIAIGIEEMRRHEVLVRRLDAVETLASVQVICFDKTGTLTLNRMAVAAVECGYAHAPGRGGPARGCRRPAAPGGGGPKLRLAAAGRLRCAARPRSRTAIAVCPRSTARRRKTRCRARARCRAGCRER